MKCPDAVETGGLPISFSAFFDSNLKPNFIKYEKLIMPKNLTQEQRQIRNAATKKAKEEGTTTRHLTGTSSTRNTYAREFDMAASVPGGVRPRGLSIGEITTTTNIYENRTEFSDGRPKITTPLPPVTSTNRTNRLHKHELVPEWHTPSGSRRATDIDTKTYGDVSAESVRKKATTWDAP
ncbi:hypothetical protein [Undibacterium crateris]|uniref:hypothetical protein n=1 Tax=Undibacterium crateris TaxID=2528175 RepID=UPI0013898882|nr:hypothetical protein [Undibacterium crateris]NDI84149.1 hypothetical protein [Undibacterium crateris]